MSADALDHPVAPQEPTAAERRGLALAILAAAALHLVIPLGLLLWYRLSPPPPAPPLKEIPVEVVVEQPPPKQQKPEEKPKPQPQPDDERPAYDAPSAATQEKANRESADKKTQAPAAKTEPSPTPGAPQKSETPPAAQEQMTQTAPPREDMKPTPDADRPAAPSASPSETDATPPASAVAQKPAPPPAPEPPAKAPVGVPLPTDDVLPDYKLAHAATESPIAGGNADTRYFTIVFGMIMSHLREPPRGASASRGSIVFLVDEAGNLLGRKIVNTSGSPNLDMAVMAAIAEAAPYPAPPGWRRREMQFFYR